MADPVPREQQKCVCLCAHLRQAGAPGNYVCEFCLRARYTDLEAELSALRARQQELEQALHEALEGWEYAAQYKGDHLAKKHGDAEDIAELRLVLSLRPSVKEQP